MVAVTFMPRVRSTRYNQKKSKAVNELKSVELEEQIEVKNSQKKEITDNIVQMIPTLIQKKIDLFSSKVNQNLNGI